MKCESIGAPAPCARTSVIGASLEPFTNSESSGIAPYITALRQPARRRHDSSNSMTTGLYGGKAGWFVPSMHVLSLLLTWMTAKSARMGAMDLSSKEKRAGGS
jgi:hypothetical protein